MNDGDPELLRRLAHTDAARPPAAMTTFSVARLHQLAARRVRRQLLGGAMAVLALAVLISWWARPAARSEVETTHAAQLGALRLELEHLQQSLQAWTQPPWPRAPSADAAEPRNAERDQRHAAKSELRFELAKVRADAALALAMPPSAKDHHR